MSAILTARGMQKSYGDFQALRDVTFQVEPGSIVGLIGPNGAGKTTTLKSILGLTDFDGDLDVMGVDPRNGRHHLMEKVCFIADVGVLPRWLKVSDALESNYQIIILDFHNVNYMDSSAIGELAACMAETKKNGGQMAITRLRPKVRKVLQIMAFLDYFQVYDSVEDALQITRRKAQAA